MTDKSVNKIRLRLLSGTMSLAGEFVRDLTFEIRLLWRSPGFLAIVTLTLAIGIGANTAIFSVVNALLFKSVFVAAPEDMAQVRPGESMMSWPNYQDLRRANDVFTDLAAHRNFIAALANDDRPIRLIGELTSANFFTVLGVPAAAGHTFSETDSRRDVVVIAHHLWRTRFGSDNSVIGRVLNIAGQSYEVIGIMPTRFRGLAPPGMLMDFWIPVNENAPNFSLQNRREGKFEIAGRLKTGISHDEAAATLRVIAQRLRTDQPDIPTSFLEMEVLSIDGFGAFRGMSNVLIPVLAFLVLMTIVSVLVLVIGCANIAGLLIARSLARRREIGVRIALGASRIRLARQFLAECVVLASLGGAAGILVAIWLLSGANALASRLPVPLEFDLRMDYRVLLYTLGISLLTALVFGALPAWRASGLDIAASLKDDSRVGGRHRLRRGLVVGQVTACSLLLVWSGLFLRSLQATNDVNPGFDPSGILLANVELGIGPGRPEDRAGAEQMLIALQQRVQESVAVQSAGMSLVVPLALLGREDFDVWTEGAPRGSAGRRVVANRLSPGWFETVRIPFLAGRDFSWNDHAQSPAVIVVNETLARQLWAGDALGKRLLVPGPKDHRPAEIIGIVRDSKYLTLGEAIRPTVYLPFRQANIEVMTLHVRTADMKSTTEIINQEMRRLAPGVAVDIYPMADAVAAALVPARIGAACTGAFGIVAMLLAAMGVYGLVSFMVALRTREIGIRKALGARTVDIIRLVVGGSVTLAMMGATLGLSIGVAGGLALQAFLVGVSPADPLTLIAVAAATITAALLATVVPAIKAVRVDSIAAVREM